MPIGDSRYWENWYYRETSLVAKDGGITHTLLSEWYNDAVKRPEPAFLGWSPDSTAAFVFDLVSGDECDRYEHAINIDRIDLPSGARLRLVDAAASPALSSDGHALALLKGEPVKGFSVTIVDAKTSRELVTSDRFAFRTQGEAGYGAANNVHWSEDAGTIMITVIDGTCGGDQFWATARMDPATGAVSGDAEGHSPPPKQQPLVSIPDLAIELPKELAEEGDHSINISRQYNTPEEGALLRIAEAADVQDPYARKLPDLGLGLDSPEWSRIHGILQMAVVSTGAVRYYWNVSIGYQDDDEFIVGRPFHATQLSYNAAIRHEDQYSHAEENYRDVFVVSMSLTWGQYCGSLCGTVIHREKIVVLRKGGEVLAVYHDYGSNTYF